MSLGENPLESPQEPQERDLRVHCHIPGSWLRVRHTVGALFTAERQEQSPPAGRGYHVSSRRMAAFPRASQCSARTPSLVLATSLALAGINSIQRPLKGQRAAAPVSEGRPVSKIHSTGRPATCFTALQCLIHTLRLFPPKYGTSFSRAYLVPSSADSRLPSAGPSPALPPFPSASA